LTGEEADVLVVLGVIEQRHAAVDRDLSFDAGHDTDPRCAK
jgi:hypothetical protein